MRHLYENILIFSGEERLIREVLNQKDISYQSCVGSYKGKTEPSFIVNAKYRRVVEALCYVNNEECYMESHNDRYCDLVYRDGRRESIGKLVQVDNPDNIDSWTHDTLSNTFWTTIQTKQVI